LGTHLELWDGNTQKKSHNMGNVGGQPGGKLGGRGDTSLQTRLRVQKKSVVKVATKRRKVNDLMGTREENPGLLYNPLESIPDGSGPKEGKSRVKGLIVLPLGMFLRID